MTTHTTNWKSRAEYMLHQFIHGDDYPNEKSHFSHDDYPTWSILHENSSSANRSPDTCFYGTYPPLLGCDCTDSYKYACESVISSWVRLVLGRMMRIYLSNPLLLAFVPLIVGIGIGCCIGRYFYLGSGNPIARTPSSFKSRAVLSYSAIAIYASDMLQRWKLFIVVFLSYIPLTIFPHKNPVNHRLFDQERDKQARIELRSNEYTRESGVAPQHIPRHIAVIMDGNRRYGTAKYGNATRGHWDGSKTLIEFSKWCIAEGIETLTVFAFSTENWDRDPNEISALMGIFLQHCEELRVEAIDRGIRIHVLTTDGAKIPLDVREGIHRMVSQTEHCSQFTMNICLSYGARGEIVNACKSIVKDVLDGTMEVDRIGETEMQRHMLTSHCCDPDVVIRTSGEERLSNFLLWQSAYSELFFLKKQWPELEKEDLLKIIRTFASGRKRRYGR